MNEAAKPAPVTAMARMGKCCPGMKMVLARTRESDSLGLKLEPMWDISNGKLTAQFVIRTRKAKDKNEAHANATYVLVTFCPFCGARLRKETE